MPYPVGEYYKTIELVNVVSFDKEIKEYIIEITSNYFAGKRFSASVLDLNILIAYIPNTFTGIDIEKIQCNTDVSSITLNNWYSIYFQDDD